MRLDRHRAAGRRHDPVRRVAGGNRGSRSEAAAAGTRRLDHGDPIRARPGDRAQGICAQLQARRADRAGPDRSRPNACSNGPRSTRSPSPTRRGGWWRGSPRSRRPWCKAMRSALLHASDAAPDGVRKLNAALRRNAETMRPRSVAVLDAFTSAQLDLALGRSNVVHAALLAGPESKAVLTRSARLERFRTGTVGERPLKSPRNGNGMAETTEKTGDKKLSITTDQDADA